MVKLDVYYTMHYHEKISVTDEELKQLEKDFDPEIIWDKLTFDTGECVEDELTDVFNGMEVIY